MKGVVLAGGRGTRLGELTRSINKHLLPVGNRPMIDHAIMKLTCAGVRDIMVVTGTDHIEGFMRSLGSGRRHNCQLTYRVQDEPNGIAGALGLAENFVGKSNCCVILGDNIFYDKLNPHVQTSKPAHVFLKSVEFPRRFGVADLDPAGRITRIVEKPDHPATDLAVTGIYVYPPSVFEIIEGLHLSGRNELEITDVNQTYADKGWLGHTILSGYWTDAGTIQTWFAANKLVNDQPPLF